MVATKPSWLELGPAASPFASAIAACGEERALMKTPSLQAGRAQCSQNVR